MKNKRLTLLTLSAALLTSTSVTAFAGVVDERNPAYLKMLTHLHNAQRALAVVQRELDNARATHAVPGMNIDVLLHDIAHHKNKVDSYLEPDTRRWRYQHLAPQAIYFHEAPAIPQQSGENP